MSRIENSKWKLSLAGFTAFILGSIFYLITGPNLIGILGFLISAIVLFFLNAGYVIYRKIKAKKGKEA
ncbi:hypothetical protein [Planococcus ruber]|uniref:hypothetical protein n=1 Tax=Planococcus ruber TaxID=2027871 RepID=UPI001FEF424B|nr:hypothetical protein [Planococcus ruber]MCJ1908977.1 hypothetical protein [Planococcus ruber]